MASFKIVLQWKILFVFLNIVFVVIDTKPVTLKHFETKGYKEIAEPMFENLECILTSYNNDNEIFKSLQEISNEDFFSSKNKKLLLFNIIVNSFNSSTVISSFSNEIDEIFYY